MMWPFTRKQVITKQDIEKLKQDSEALAERAAKYEQAALDSEEQWMLVKCKPKEKVEHPLRRETDAVCVT